MDVGPPRWHYDRICPPAVPGSGDQHESAGLFVHWSIFDVSVANLVLIAVMVVIFGAALLLPFPRGHRDEAAAVAGGGRRAGGRWHGCGE